jgi:hypothetical protein
MSASERDARVETEIAAPLRQVRPALDELHRARLTSAIEGALDREDEAIAARRAPGTRHRRASTAAAGIVVAAALGALIFWRGPRPQVEVPVAHLPARDAPAFLLRDRGTEEGGPSARTPSTSLLALAGERARATIGTRVRVTLVGPGRVSTLPAGPGDVQLALDSGRLLVDYDGHAGGILRVRSPGAVTTVVGTLFAVEAGASGSRVAVARGRVRTEDGAGHLWQVAAGDSWTSAEGRLSPISDELAAALVRHEAAWASETAAARPLRDVPPAAHRSAPAAPTRPGVDLEALYAQAEAAMRARALGEARRTLETIASADSNGQLGEAALLDLARLALADGDRAEARRALGRLPRRLADPALAETANHLRCRAEHADGAGDGGAPCGP